MKESRAADDGKNDFFVSSPRPQPPYDTKGSPTEDKVAYVASVTRSETLATQAGGSKERGPKVCLIVNLALPRSVNLKVWLGATLLAPIILSNRRKNLTVADRCFRGTQRQFSAVRKTI